MIAADRPGRRSPSSRLLVVDARGEIVHVRRAALVNFLRPGDLVVANDAATLPASLTGRHVPSGRTIEVRLAGRDSLSPEGVCRFSACVTVPNATPWARIAASAPQSNAKPAEGASNAAGCPATAVHTSHSANGSGTCAYWIGRPCRARPAHTPSAEPSNRNASRRGWPSRRSTVARSGPSSIRSPASSGGGGGRSSVRV